MAVLLLVLADARPVAAAAAYVQQDATPIVSKPGVGGKILTWVDAGFPLTVLAVDGDWVKVASPQLALPAQDLWVPAARVGASVPGQIDVAWRGQPPAAGAAAADFRLAVDGTWGAGFRAHCRVVGGGEERLLAFVDAVPAVIGLEGAAIDCVVRKLDRSGRLEVALLARDGAVIATTAALGAQQSVQVRSAGPWGSAEAVAGPAEFVVFEPMPGMIRRPFPGISIPPLDNPVPPFRSSPVPPFRRSPVPVQ